MAEYLDMGKREQDALKDVGGFVGGSLSGPRRKAEAVTGRDLVTLDYDALTLERAEWLKTALEALGCGYCIYSTRKHRPEAPRLRVIVPLDRTATPDEYGPVARMIAQRIGFDGVDPTTFEVARMMFYPSVCADGKYIFTYADKPLLSVSLWRQSCPILYGWSWESVATWPAIPGSENKLRADVKQQDPEGKNGIVGTFCRTYDIYRCIAELIPGVYEQVDNAGERYTFVGGSTAGGAVIYDGGKFLFSHHATDPCSGKLVNAFDLVRLHRFGHLDDNAEPGCPVGRLPSYSAMADWARSLPEIHAAILNEDFADLEPVPGESADWKKHLEFSNNGGLRSTLNNISLLLENEVRFAGKLRKDTFNDRIVVEGELPWQREPGEPLNDTDLDNIRLALDRLFDGKVAAADVITAVNVAAGKRAFHPVRAYLDGLTWDGVPRLDTLFIDYLGAEDSPYTRAVTRKSFVAAVARIMAPGCKFDTMLILTGKQGRFKSTCLSIMAGSFFSDSLRTFTGKEAAEGLRGAWIIEISELQAFDRASTEEVKAFLSKQTDRYRPAYGRMLQEYPRQCVFFGTTNSATFLRDTTGGRRFWPVSIDQQERTKSVVNELHRERDQLWAEAVARYRAHEPLFLSGEIETTARELQEAAREVDPWESLLLDFVERKIPEDWHKWPLDRRRDFLCGQACSVAGGPALKLVERQTVSATEFLCEALGFAQGNMSQRDSILVNKILRGLKGWEPSPDRWRTSYSQVRGYRRVR